MLVLLGLMDVAMIMDSIGGNITMIILLTMVIYHMMHAYNGYQMIDFFLVYIVCL